MLRVYDVADLVLEPKRLLVGDEQPSRYGSLVDLVTASSARHVERGGWSRNRSGVRSVGHGCRGPDLGGPHAGGVIAGCTSQGAPVIASAKPGESDFASPCHSGTTGRRDAKIAQDARHGNRPGIQRDAAQLFQRRLVEFQVCYRVERLIDLCVAAACCSGMTGTGGKSLSPGLALAITWRLAKCSQQ